MSGDILHNPSPGDGELPLFRSVFLTEERTTVLECLLLASEPLALVVKNWWFESYGPFSHPRLSQAVGPQISQSDLTPPAILGIDTHLSTNIFERYFRKMFCLRLRCRICENMPQIAR